MPDEDIWRSTSALYESERWPWAEDAPVPKPPDLTFDCAVCNKTHGLPLCVPGEEWFKVNGAALRADSEAVSSQDYAQDAQGRWSRASGNRGKGGIAL